MAKFEFGGFRFADDYYTAEGAKVLQRENLAGMKKEYSRMREVANRRLERLSHNYGWTKTFQNNKAGFARISDIPESDFYKAFSEVAKFLNAKSSTVSGQRDIQATTTQSLNEAVGAFDPDTGRTTGGVNRRNYQRVINILDEARKRKLTYGSDKMVTLAEATLHLSAGQFDEVIDNLEKWLSHADSAKEALSGYMDNNRINKYTRVDMSDFIEQIGW